MSNTPNIDKLTMGELILPGAHNSGSDDKGNYVFGPAKHWAVCQNDSFYYQLVNGARALDLRLEFDLNNTPSDSFFYFHHNGTRSYRELSQLVRDADRFLQENPDEFIIFDFHKLERGNRSFHFQEFSDRLVKSFAHRIIPTYNSNKTLGDLKKASRTQRVLLAAGWQPDLHRESFSRPIEHKWSGSSITNTQTLNAHIENVLKSSPSSTYPWSLSATAYTVAGGPVDIQKELNEWFDVSKPWIHKCSIINADFFEESNLVAHCRMANAIKANQRIK
jgi:1-phosphatidylinositol phosphodiesterase